MLYSELVGCVLVGCVLSLVVTGRSLVAIEDAAVLGSVVSSSGGVPDS